MAARIGFNSLLERQATHSSSHWLNINLIKIHWTPLGIFSYFAKQHKISNRNIDHREHERCFLHNRMILLFFGVSTHDPLSWPYNRRHDNGGWRWLAKKNSFSLASVSSIYFWRIFWNEFCFFLLSSRHSLRSEIRNSPNETLVMLRASTSKLVNLIFMTRFRFLIFSALLISSRRYQRLNMKKH